MKLSIQWIPKDRMGEFMDKLNHGCYDRLEKSEDIETVWFDSMASLAVFMQTYCGSHGMGFHVTMSAEGDIMFLVRKGEVMSILPFRTDSDDWIFETLHAISYWMDTMAGSDVDEDYHGLMPRPENADEDDRLFCEVVRKQTMMKCERLPSGEMLMWDRQREIVKSITSQVKGGKVKSLEEGKLGELFGLLGIDKSKVVEDDNPLVRQINEIMGGGEK